MRKLLFALSFLATTALAGPYYAEYEVEKTIYFALYTQDDPPALQTSATFSPGDCKISEDGNAPVNCDNLPVNIGEGIYSWTMPVAELNNTHVVMTLQDAGGTGWIDFDAVIETYNNDSAEHSNLGNDQLMSEVVIDSTAVDIDVRDALCFALAQLVGEATVSAGVSQTFQDPDGAGNVVTITFGTPEGTRTAVSLTPGNC